MAKTTTPLTAQERVIQFRTATGISHTAVGQAALDWAACFARPHSSAGPGAAAAVEISKAIRVSDDRSSTNACWKNPSPQKYWKYGFSTPLRGSGITWTAEALDTFIADPQASVPANRMPYAGMPDAADRADLITYLRKVSKSSAP